LRAPKIASELAEILRLHALWRRDDADADRWTEYTSALKSVRDAANEEIAALEADLAAQVWRPVSDGTYILRDGGPICIDAPHIGLNVGSPSTTYEWAELPPHLALCELVGPDAVPDTEGEEE